MSHKDLAHGGLSLSGKDYMKSSLIGGPSGEIFLAQGGGPLGRMYPCSVGIALRGGLDIGLAHEVLTHWGALWGDFSRSGGGRGGPFGEDVSLLSGDCPQGRTRHRPRPPGSRPSGEAGPQFSFA